MEITVRKLIKNIFDSWVRVSLWLFLSISAIVLISDIYFSSGVFTSIRQFTQTKVDHIIGRFLILAYFSHLPARAYAFVRRHIPGFWFFCAIFLALVCLIFYRNRRCLCGFIGWLFRQISIVFVISASIFFLCASFFFREDRWGVLMFIIAVGLTSGILLVLFQNGVLLKRLSVHIRRYILCGVSLFLNLKNGWTILTEGLCRKLKRILVEYQPTPLYLSDRALGENGEEYEDELGFTDDAKRFAEDVLNNGSSDPMVFGLDAPWGSGKSSYLTLCKDLAWNKKRNLVVVHFKPILYDLKRLDLFDVFSGELLASLREAGVPAFFLARHLRALGELIDGVSHGMIWKVISFFLGSFSLSSTRLIESIEKDIQGSGKKLIVIVDDLDRLYLEDVKEMLGIVRNVFHVKNMTFVLCYDSESVNTFEFQKKTVHIYSYQDGDAAKKGGINRYSHESHEPNNQAINAYFEKIVQVKKTLIPNRTQLEAYFIKQVGERGDAFREGIEYIFSHVRFPSYSALIGDIRKIKRIVNFVKASGLLDADYDNIDIAPKYLLQFVILYINFPHVFRKIYIEETDGASGFFSLVPTENGSQSFPFTNSDKLKEYLEIIGDSERFIIEELFCIKDIKDDYERNQQESVYASEEFQRISPMFNGGLHHRKNLEGYLQLIVERRLRPFWEYDNFHLNKVGELGQKSVKDVFNETPEYGVEHGEFPREKFFSNFGSVKGDFGIVDKVIQYILNNRQCYSLVNKFLSTYDGLRDNLVYQILYLLNQRGWPGDPADNGNDANISVIADRIFGLGDYFDKGIFDKILDESKGILGLHDGLYFLSGCRGSGNEGTFNVRSALMLHGGKDGKEGSIRELSQKLFLRFKERYISPKRNLVQDIESLSEKELLGDFSEFITKEFRDKGQDIDAELAKIRDSLIGHIIGQLASQKADALGRYDEAGANDGNGIAKSMRSYIFDACFDVDTDTENARRFVNYMLASLSHSYERKGHEFIPKLSDFQSWLGDVELEAYWRKNHEKIKKYCRSLSLETQVFTYNYVANYRDDLEDLFVELDKLLTSTEESI